MTNDFSGNESKQLPLPRPNLPLSMWPSQTACCCSSAGRRIGTAGDCTLAVWFSILRGYVREERWILYSAACPLGYQVQYHPSEQIFDCERVFVLHCDHLGNMLLMWCIGLLSCFALFVFKWQSTPHWIYCPDIGQVTQLPIAEYVCLGCVFMSSFNYFTHQQK